MKDLHRKTWVTRCPHCKRWQCKQATNYGKEVINCTCVFCNKKFNVKVTGRIFYDQQAGNAMRKAAYASTVYPGFGTYKPKGGK